MSKKQILILIWSILGTLILLMIIFFFINKEDIPPIKENEPTNTGTINESISQEGIQKVINANNQFAFDLYNNIALSNNDSNILYSPYSIFSALAMTYEWARNQTAEEMKSVLHFPEIDILRPNFAEIYNEINSTKRDFELKTGNALWGQYDYPFLDSYVNTVEKYYGGKITNLDFKEKTEESRKTINTYIEDQTNGRIKDLIPAWFIHPTTKLILTNAIYFKATWKWSFDRKNTQEEDFKVSTIKKVKVPMMKIKPEEEKFNYANLEKLEILELPYKWEKLSMFIILPKQGEYYNPEKQEYETLDYNLEDLELSLEDFNDYKSQMKEQNLDSISIPKFEFNTKYFMKEILSTLWMQWAFLDADFSGMDGQKNLFISEVIHQAFIKVDEKGTEAAATTAVIMKELAMIPTNNFKANHPFIFIIQENETNNILFMGKVNNPCE